MKKTLTTIIAFFALTTQALACDGFYMGLRAGIANHNVGETGATNTNRFNVDDNNLMIAGALGYRYGHYRAEFEYTWREEGEKSSGATSSTFQTESYMVNGFYDLTPYSRYTPFIMAGLGMTEITTGYSFGGGAFADQDFEETNFTWSVGGGVSAKLTNRWNLDVGYRFYNMGEIEDASVRNHEVYGGARYVF